MRTLVEFNRLASGAYFVLPDDGHGWLCLKTHADVGMGRRSKSCVKLARLDGGRGSIAVGNVEADLAMMPRYVLDISDLVEITWDLLSAVSRPRKGVLTVEEEHLFLNTEHEGTPAIVKLPSGEWWMPQVEFFGNDAGHYTHWSILVKLGGDNVVEIST